MRVAFVTETFLPKIDGIVVKVTHVLDHLEKRGHESILFAPKNDTPASYGSTPIYTRRGVKVPFYPELRLGLPIARLEEEIIDFNPQSLGHDFQKSARSGSTLVVG